MRRYVVWGSLAALAVVLLLAGVVTGAEKTYQFVLMNTSKDSGRPDLTVTLTFP